MSKGIHNKIIKKIDELIEEGERYQEDYDFLEFTLWKNKVEFLLKELGGESYVNLFFECFHGNGKKYQKDLREEFGDNEDLDKHADALFQIIISNHKQDVQRVLNLLTAFKEDIKRFEITEIIKGKRELKDFFGLDSSMVFF